MKHFSLILLLAIIGHTDPASGRPVMGWTGGFNFANVDLEMADAPDTKTKTGFLFGLALEKPMTEDQRGRLRLEILYVMKGCIASGNTPDGSGNIYDWEATGWIDEIVLAPLWVQRFSSRGITPFLFAGPELGFTVTAVYELRESSASLVEEHDVEEWTSLNYSVNLGGGVAIPSGRGEFVADARYNLGLQNGYSGDLDLTARTYGIQVKVGYNFTGKGHSSDPAR